jgi:hypothetical protein
MDGRKAVEWSCCSVLQRARAVYTLHWPLHMHSQQRDLQVVLKCIALLQLNVTAARS